MTAIPNSSTEANRQVVTQAFAFGAFYALRKRKHALLTEHSGE